jgi:hypothetical protein
VHFSTNTVLEPRKIIWAECRCGWERGYIEPDDAATRRLVVAEVQRASDRHAHIT